MTVEEWDFMMLECWSPHQPICGWEEFLPGARSLNAPIEASPQFDPADWVQATKMSDDRRAELSKTLIEVWKTASPERRAQAAKSLALGPHRKPPASVETRAKLSKANTGKTHSPETRAKLSARGKGQKRNLGTTYTPEQRANVSRGHINQRVPQGVIEKVKVFLSHGYRYREISQMTGVSGGTISRVKNGIYLDLP
jgi:hypothetical protein